MIRPANKATKRSLILIMVTKHFEFRQFIQLYFLGKLITLGGGSCSKFQVDDYGILHFQEYKRFTGL